MYIIKRNGNKATFSPQKINSRIKNASKYIIVGDEKVSAKQLNVDTDEVFVNVVQGLADGMSTKELDVLLAQTSASFSARHYDYSTLSSRIAISRLHKETEDTFEDASKKLLELKLISITQYDKYCNIGFDKLNKLIKPERDFNFDYFAWSRLENIYLLKDSDEVMRERPQYMYMRIAVNLNDTIDEVKEHYDMLSNHLLSHATPTMLNAGTPNGQLASCNLNFAESDTRDGLLNTFNRACISSSKAEGIGLALHNIRSRYSTVGSSNGKAGGLLKYCKILNDGMRFFDQSGKRPGSLAVYIEPWHRDFFDVIDMRKNTGADELRAKDLFIGLWIPDNFMRAVKSGSKYHLFCPKAIKDAGLTSLHTIYGEEFDEVYNKAVELGIGKEVEASEMWTKILESQVETGLPYMLYKDSVNKKSNHANYGTTFSSNLCVHGNTYIDIIRNNKKERIMIKDLTQNEVIENNIQVLSNNLNGINEYKKITAFAQTNPKASVIKITDSVTGKELILTPEHKVYTKNRGYVIAEKLTENDELVIL